MRDTIILGITSGLIGNVIKDISNYFIWRANKTEMLYGHYAASTLVEPVKTIELKNFLIGQALDMTYGAALGVPLVYLIKKTGRDYYLLKGAGLGLLLWGILYNYGPASIKPKETKTHLSALFNNLLYGISTAQAAVSLAHPGIFPESNSKDSKIKG